MYFSPIQGWLLVPLPKICHTYPTIMKLGSKKYTNHVTHLLRSADSNIFFTRNQQILLYEEIQIQIAFWFIISNFSTFFVSLKIFLINTYTILTMSTKMVTLSLLIIKVFWNKSYEVISSIHDVTRKEAYQGKKDS